MTITKINLGIVSDIITGWKINLSIAAAAVTSWGWLPELAKVSEIAAQLLPIAGVGWILLQVGYLIVRGRKP